MTGFISKFNCSCVVAQRHRVAALHAIRTMPLHRQHRLDDVPAPSNSSMRHPGRLRDVPTACTTADVQPAFLQHNLASHTPTTTLFQTPRPANSTEAPCCAHALLITSVHICTRSLPPVCVSNSLTTLTVTVHTPVHDPSARTTHTLMPTVTAMAAARLGNGGSHDTRAPWYIRDTAYCCATCPAALMRSTEQVQGIPSIYVPSSPVLSLRRIPVVCMHIVPYVLYMYFSVGHQRGLQLLARHCLKDTLPPAFISIGSAYSRATHVQQ
jgi:hypothetical protein